MRTYKNFHFSCKSIESEFKLMDYIDSLGDNPTELPDVSQENYEIWHCDYDFDGVEALVLPDSIKRIGKCVFAQSKIKNLTADGVEHIDELAFYNTKELVTLSAKSCTDLISTDSETGEFTDGADCFNHSAVRSLYLPNVQVVGRYCFYDMPNLQVLNLPSLISLEPHAVYGNDKLKTTNLGELQEAKFSAITMNPSLDTIVAKNLVVQDELAIHSNGNNCKVETDGQIIKIISPKKLNCQTDKKALEQALQPEEFNYTYHYKGFKYNISPDLENKNEIVAELNDLIEEWLKAGQIPNSPYADTNESGYKALTAVVDMFVPEGIERIGDYAFSKCYHLQSLVADSVKVVCDHAFYCDGAIRYLSLKNCQKLEHDALNGTACDVTEELAKVFVPNVKKIGKHAFWQTGYKLISLPSCDTLQPTAIEENEQLQMLVVKSLNCANCVTGNPQLGQIKQLQPKELISNAVGGSSVDNIASQPGSEE